mmetsp:Transcript_9522/g.26785  ORF Transcript_9522/g.26785 Transcript_9522/m.26785 type:complete len:243 (+) Transcript_9522:927-1655(+)
MALANAHRSSSTAVYGRGGVCGVASTRRRAAPGLGAVGRRRGRRGRTGVLRSAAPQTCSGLRVVQRVGLQGRASSPHAGDAPERREAPRRSGLRPTRRAELPRQVPVPGAVRREGRCGPRALLLRLPERKRRGPTSTWAWRWALRPRRGRHLPGGCLATAGRPAGSVGDRLLRRQSARPRLQVPVAARAAGVGAESAAAAARRGLHAAALAPSSYQPNPHGSPTALRQGAARVRGGLGLDGA